MSRPIGVLRPEPGNAATAARIAARGHRALCLPLFAARAIAWSVPDPGDYDSLVLTSANVLRHGGAGLSAFRHVPVHAVGETTAAAARDAGFTVVATGDGGVDALHPSGRTLHLAGRDHHPIAGADTIIVYASEALDTDLSSLSGGVALLHSARAARRLAERLGDRSRITLAAISQAVADAAGAGWPRIVVAERPTDAALIDAGCTLAD